MKQTTLTKLKLSAASIVLGSVLSAPAYASSDSQQQIVNAIGYSSINILSALNTYFHESENAYNAWIQRLIVNNATQAEMSSTSAVPAQSDRTTTAFIFSATTANSSSNPQQQQNVPGVIPLPTPGMYAAMVPIERTPQGLAKSSYLSSGALLGSTKFASKDDQNQASVFIQFLADAGSRFTPVSGQVLQKADSSLVAAYLNSLATYNAGLSVALNALNNLFYERVPLPQLNGDSPLSFEQKQVLNRMQPNWTSNVAQMTLIDVARESLYTQAETNYQLFQMRMQLEQITLLLAAQQMQQLQNNGKTLLQAKAQAVTQSATNQSTTQ